MKNPSVTSGKTRVARDGSKDASEKNPRRRESYRSYSVRHHATKHLPKKHNLLHTSTQRLMEQAYQSTYYEQMVRFNRLSLKRWLSRSEYIEHRYSLLDYQHMLIEDSF